MPSPRHQQAVGCHVALAILCLALHLLLPGLHLLLDHHGSGGGGSPPAADGRFQMAAADAGEEDCPLCRQFQAVGAGDLPLSTSPVRGVLPSAPGWMPPASPNPRRAPGLCAGGARGPPPA